MLSFQHIFALIQIQAPLNQFTNDSYCLMKRSQNTRKFFKKLMNGITETIHFVTQNSIVIIPIVSEKFQTGNNVNIILKIVLLALFHWAMVRKIKSFLLDGQVFQNKSHIQTAIEELKTLKYRSPP